MRLVYVGYRSRIVSCLSVVSCVLKIEKNHRRCALLLVEVYFQYACEYCGYSDQGTVAIHVQCTSMCELCLDGDNTAGRGVCDGGV